ncbi:MAG TPA: GNAT family N-acetyltransferase [Stellaceae bacterium]|nr:GNAT family N-acetyltransferase [Stellaceae bacterium]
MGDLKPTTSVERLTGFRRGDLDDLCDATEAAIGAGGGFGWVTVPSRDLLEAYWKGVLMVPERQLFVGRLDGVIAASAQLVRPSRHNEAQHFTAQLQTSFVAPWARGHGLAKAITLAVEEAALLSGVALLNLDIRDTLTPAIALYEALGYIRWAEHPFYALIDGRPVRGLYYYKVLDAGLEGLKLDQSGHRQSSGRPMERLS